MRRCLLVLIPLSLIYGCGSLPELLSFLNDINSLINQSNETGSARIRAFETQDEFSDYFSARFNEQRGGSGNSIFCFACDMMDFDEVALESADNSVGGAAAPTSDDQGSRAADGDFSQTTTQERGVDESDVVKTDGDNLYIISDGTLRIVRAPSADQLSAAGEVSLEGNGREIYLLGSTVIALSETYGGFFGDVILREGSEFVDDGDAISDRPDGSGDSIAAPQFSGPTSVVTVIDVSSPDAPQVVSTTSFDGSISASRMIDGMLHLVLANYQSYYYLPIPMIGFADDQVSSADAEALLPRFEQVDESGVTTSGPVLTWQELYRPEDPDGFGVVTVVSMDVESGDFSSVGIVAEPGLVYSSRDALYLTDTNYDFFGNTRETTDIHKLAYGSGSDMRATPVASGSVPGRILNQYSMGEHNGFLRVATTVGRSFGPFGLESESSNGVYVLGEVDGELVSVGSVENIASGESIQSCRFAGDRGYVVTFREIDPLFTLDLSDPTDPTVVGELKVPGFSTYVVEMDSDHLLTVGQYIPEDGPFFGNWGVQLSIFDVSDFANPTLKHNVVLGEDTGAGSEALYNPKAFTYFAERGLVALPISIYSNNFFLEDFDIEDFDIEFVDSTDSEEPDNPATSDGQDEPVEPVDEPADEPTIIDDFFVPDGFEGLVLYDVSTDEGFSELGRISTRFEQAGFYWNAFTRGVIIGDDVFAVTNNGVAASPIDAIQDSPFELVLTSPDSFGTSEPGDAGVSPGEPEPNNDDAVKEPRP